MVVVVGLGVVTAVKQRVSSHPVSFQAYADCDMGMVALEILRRVIVAPM